ncbi:lysozyme inhibitor LprI family protein [Flavihumibacter sp.]|uniref:lysozyme inhibitor LprI family protein n=1 Tax=Flavihumibacter sp. TaxID=1913981 RepID=UPI002FC7BD51
MKPTLLILSIFICQLSVAQIIDTTDIFEVDKLNYLVLKPEVEQKINKRIEPIIKQKLEKFKIDNKSNFETLTDEQRLDEIEFAKDTIRINEFLSEYDGSYSMATTTMGMNWKGSKYMDAYDNFLNKYYQKSLSVLTPEMKRKLIDSQRKWLDFFIKEKEFIFDLNDFGNHNSRLYCWSYYFEMIEKRVFFLRNIYNRNFNGSNTYK